jgi:hypothetical protein
MPHHIIFTTLQGASRADIDAARAWLGSLYRSERYELLMLLLDRREGQAAEWIGRHGGEAGWARAMKAQER